MRDKFSEIIDSQNAQIKKHDVPFTALGFIKLALLVALCVFLYYLISGRTSDFLLTLTGINFAVLTAIWIYHVLLHRKIKRCQSKLALTKRYLSRISGKWTAFTDCGEEFTDADHPFSSDLDIVGKKSLFQLLNVTKTYFGRNAFKEALTHPDFSASEILKRQAAVHELSADAEFLVNTEYVFSKIGLKKTDASLVGAVSTNAPFMGSPILRFLVRILPIFTCAAILTVLIFQISDFYFPALIVAFAQTGIWIAGLFRTSAYLKPVDDISNDLGAYSEAITYLRGCDFKSELLRDMINSLSGKENSAAVAIRSLSRIMAMVSVKNHFLVGAILNILLLWDFRTAIALENWRRQYSQLAEGWFKAIGEFESLMCLAVFPNVVSKACLPEIAAGQAIKASEIGHPLIPNETRVVNDFDSTGQIFIISGSNMSGKTTFLRTVGVNTVLAQAGGFVCAGSMVASAKKIMTSMRIADDLTDGVSTFYAELKRIRGIVESAKNGEILFLIDEIFRGTNSVDRLSGGETVISRLHKLGAAGFITTHDLDLCELEKTISGIRNYSFSEYYSDGKICFDYKISEGKSKTTNARYIMEMVGLI